MPEHDPTDPIERLSRLGSALGGGDMPMAAADVRRRGDRIRRRRTALVAGGAALAVAAVAVPVLALTAGDGDDRRDLVTKDPAGVTALGEADLLSDDDTVYSDGADWFEKATVTGGDGLGFHLCDREGLRGLGATSSLQRMFELRNTLDPDVEVTGDRFRESIAEFPDAASAAAAYATVADWIQDCTDLAAANDTPDYRPFEPRSIDPGPADSEAQVIDAHFGPVPNGDADAAYIAETGLIRVGNRIAVLDSVIVGQDYNFLDGTPVERMIPRAAALLAPGDPATPARPTGTAEAGATAIPDDFPLGEGWPYGTEADGEGLIGPARDLDPAPFEACGTTLDDPAHEDRLMARWQSVDYRTRQLTTYATVEEATRAITAIADLYRACPTDQERADGSTPRWEVRDLDDGSYAVFGWDESDGVAGTFGSTMVLVQVGNAVLLTAWSGHAGNPEAGGEEALDVIGLEAAPVVEEMCVFTATGC